MGKLQIQAVLSECKPTCPCPGSNSWRLPASLVSWTSAHLLQRFPGVSPQALGTDQPQTWVHPRSTCQGDCHFTMIWTQKAWALYPRCEFFFLCCEDQALGKIFRCQISFLAATVPTFHKLMQSVVLKLFWANTLLMDFLVLQLLGFYPSYFLSQWAGLQVTVQILLSCGWGRKWLDSLLKRKIRLFFKHGSKQVFSFKVIM